MHGAGLLLFLLAATACPSFADLGRLDPLAKPTTRLGPGYLLALNVSIHAIDESELCGEFLLDAEGRLELTVGYEPIEKIALKGLTVSEARERIQAALAKYLVDPEVRVGIARMPRITVHVGGATFRSGPLTLPDGARLSDALAETGYLQTADLQRIQISRLEKGGIRVNLTADFSKALLGAEDRFSDPTLQEGDRITIPLSLAPVVPQTVAVLGEVQRPGTTYLYRPGMTVRDALREALGLSPSADPERVVVRRMRDNSVQTVNGARALQGVPTDNLQLEPDDTVFVMTKDSGRRYAVVGAVASPSTFDYRQPVTLKQALVDAGGFKPDADRRSVLLIRGMLRDPAKAETQIIDFDRIARGEQPDIPLEPGDLVQISPRKKANSPLVDIGLFLLRFFLF